MAKSKYYAVKKGRQTGIFYSWAECERVTKGYPGAEYKSFENIADAKIYLDNFQKALVPVQKKIEELNSDEMIAYVDGSFDLNINNYSYGVIYFHNGNKNSLYGKGKHDELIEMRNVAGEIEAAKNAMEVAVKSQVKTLYLYHDYEGIQKWCTGEWKANKNATQEYKQYYEEIKDKLKVQFIKVKSHSGDKYNEEVDLLAKKALYEQETKSVSNNMGNERQQVENIELNNDLMNSKIKATTIEPVFNILTVDMQCINTENIMEEFKRQWKKSNRKIKDIKELKIVLSLKEMKANFFIETEDSSEQIIIKL